jgi:hypothetical protein
LAIFGFRKFDVFKFSESTKKSPMKTTFFRLKVFVFASLLIGLAVLVSACWGPDDPPANLDSNEIVKIAVRQEGICRVGLAELGWEDVDLGRLQVHSQEFQVPVWTTGGGQDAKVHFYCQPSQSPYTPENIYLLSADREGGKKIAENDPTIVEGLAPIERVTSTVHFEENIHYSPVVQGGDHWFWEKLTAPQRHSLEIDLVDVAAGDGALMVALWGNTMAIADPDHHAIVWVNGQVVADETWDGQTRHTIKAHIPKGTLNEGANSIEIEFPGDTGVLVDIAYLDWVGISYNRRSRLERGSLAFTAEGEQVQFSNFLGDAYVFDVTDPAAVSVLTIREDAPVFNSEGGHRYLVVDSGGFLVPDDIEPARSQPDLKDPSKGAAYIAIGPVDLLEATAPLLDLRASQGLSVMPVPVAAIYDQFNGGMAEPGAIQQFLTYAVENWAIPPDYVLLVGDASYDFRGYVHPVESNRLPVLLVPTVYGGETASDVMMADINDDPWPDLAIGRIPARTAEQVEVYVGKVINYEGAAKGAAWQNRVLAVADGQEARFKVDAAFFLDMFPSNFQTTLVAPGVDDPSGSQDVVAEIENGYWLTAYFGHGSLTMWGKDRLFTLDDSKSLSNGDRLPIMIHLTCLTGLFTHPTQESLVESLLWQPDGGAVAILAPTSLTLPGAQEDLTKAFTDALLASPDRLGDVALQAWRLIPTDSVHSADVMKTFLLFGDPALKMPAPAP